MHANVILTNKRRTHAQSNYINTKQPGLGASYAIRAVGHLHSRTYTGNKQQLRLLQMRVYLRHWAEQCAVFLTMNQQNTRRTLKADNSILSSFWGQIIPVKRGQCLGPQGTKIDLSFCPSCSFFSPVCCTIFVHQCSLDDLMNLLVWSMPTLQSFSAYCMDIFHT